jgi:hypothetical protein
MSNQTGSAPKPSELLEESAEILHDKSAASKNMNMIASETAKMQQIEKSIIVRAKDYKYYAGAGWIDNDPLQKNPEEKFPDRVAPTFRKLLQIIDDLRAIGKTDWLDPYVQALSNHGIDLTFSAADCMVNDPDEVEAAIENMCGFQKTICTLADEINDVKALTSEDINFTPKNEFKKVLGFYDRKAKGKDVDDAYSDWVTHLEMVETAVNQVYDESLA